MASTTAAAAEEGPVLSLINKRLRALRKKLNRITQMEDSLSQGKPLNKEQEDVLKSKPSIVGAIDELEKLRLPLNAAVADEIRLVAPPQEVKGQNDSVEELLNLLYFSSMFDVRNQEDFSSLMLMKNHERESCLSYDYVTEEDTDMLSRGDLDLISQLGGLLISRPVNSSLSHKHALQLCIEHAKQWLANSEHPISSDANVTYAGLKAKLNKIMALNYFTITPKMKAPVEMAAAAGNFSSFEASEEDSVVLVQAEGSEEQYQEENAANLHGGETYESLSSPTEEPQKGESGSETSTEVASQKEQPLNEDQNHKVAETKEQHSVPRRNYQNQRSGYAGGGNGRSRGYSNGRGGRGGSRGGGGSYQNGGYNQYYDQPGDYSQRGYHQYNRVERGGGGRGGGGNYHHQNYVPKAQAGHVSAAVANS